MPAASVVALLTDLTNQYGELVNDGPKLIRTIGAFWDNVSKTKIRAASLEAGTIEALPIPGGRVAFRCLWQADLAAAFDAGNLPGAEELTEEELAELLLPQPNNQS